MPHFQFIDLADVRLRVAIEGTGPLVVMVHGFPESWFSWRHQMKPVADAGFTACAIDVRGYGGSAKVGQNGSRAVSDYAMEKMVGDVVGVIDALGGGQKAIIMGHDWGAPIVWYTALIRPDKVRAVAGLSVPYTGVPTRPLRQVFDEIFTARGRFFYQAWFQDVGPPEAEAERDPRDFLRKFYYAISGDAPDGTWPNNKKHGQSLLEGLVDPDPFPSWLTAADLDYYVGEFEQSGFFGPISRYRNSEVDYDYLKQFAGRVIGQPSAFIGGSRDLVLTMFGRSDFITPMRAQLTDLRVAEVIEGCGHWTQQERPAEVNALLVPWLKGI